ncbi:MBL fold metallo-hydrolase [Thermodesulfobacteriota bacterium]
MIEQILKNFYRIQIPLPRNPLKYLNSYVIKDRNRFLIIDTGMNREECLRPMLSGLEELKVDLNRTDFFITHFHSDHLGLIGELAPEGSKIYFSEVEASIVESAQKMDIKGRVNILKPIFRSHGFPEDEFVKAMKNHPGFRFRPKTQLHFSTLKDGQNLDIGEYGFTCIETPGHSPGHMCLYEPNKKILVSGDHILFDITPNITFWPELENALKFYMTSLDKVYALDVKIVLPGHRNIMTDHRKRIRELREHHKKRLNEAVSALKEGSENAWEVAQHLSWEIKCPSWKLFPSTQKWFAFGETIAHLDFLEGEGRVMRREDNNRILFSLL